MISSTDSCCQIITYFCSATYQQVVALTFINKKVLNVIFHAQSVIILKYSPCQHKLPYLSVRKSFSNQRCTKYLRPCDTKSTKPSFHRGYT
jgi:hypothetical protein